jgi:hypothetical protein
VIEVWNDQDVGAMGAIDSADKVAQLLTLLCGETVSLTSLSRRPEVRTSELADESTDRFAHRRGNEVELTGLGRPEKLPVLPCP